MHIAIDNFWLPSVAGRPMPTDLTSNELEKSVTRKADVIKWLSRSLEAVKMARASLKSGDLGRKVKIEGRDATVDGMYLRILIHANEHMGQSIEYARMNGNRATLVCRCLAQDRDRHLVPDCQIWPATGTRSEVPLAIWTYQGPTDSSDEAFLGQAFRTGTVPKHAVQNRRVIN